MKKQDSTLIIFVSLSIATILLLFPKPIGDDNPVNGRVQGCIGYTFKLQFEDGYLDNYYCIGIPYFKGGGF